MTQTTKLAIRYVGHKDQRTDTVAGTGLTWLGHGDVQLVPMDAVPKLLRHPDVWVLSEPGEVPAPASFVKTPDVGFFGTDHPEVIEIAGEKVELGVLIHAAAAAGGHDAAAWNALTDEARQAAVDKEIAVRQPKPAQRAAKKVGRPAGSTNKAKATATA